MTNTELRIKNETLLFEMKQAVDVINDVIANYRTDKPELPLFMLDCLRAKLAETVNGDDIK